MTEFSSRITTRIAQEISARPNQVEAAVALLDGGATVPFIARYRKDVTGNLSDAQLRILEERLIYLKGARRPPRSHPRRNRGTGKAQR